MYVVFQIALIHSDSRFGLDHNSVDVGALADSLIPDGIHTELDRASLRQRPKSNMARKGLSTFKTSLYLRLGIPDTNPRSRQRR